MEFANSILGLEPECEELKWNVESVHTKNTVSILHLLVALVHHFRPAKHLPGNVVVDVIMVQEKDGVLVEQLITEELTAPNDTQDEDQDVFDTLVDHEPEKLPMVKQKLIEFSNKHLKKINLEVTDIDQFTDGVFLILLIGFCEGYFVPLYEFFFKPKVNNLCFVKNRLRKIQSVCINLDLNIFQIQIGFFNFFAGF